MFEDNGNLIYNESRPRRLFVSSYIHLRTNAHEVASVAHTTQSPNVNKRGTLPDLHSGPKSSQKQDELQSKPTERVQARPTRRKNYSYKGHTH